MNRSFKIKLASAMVFFTAFAAVSSTIAWFIPAVSVTNSGEITGVTEGAYYAYGEGTAEKPFGITRPRHLYNLAWLQYLGTYNKPAENGKPYYFELGDNVDMTDWVLPPIGDENTPFYGNFNGNGYVVSNLTISNDFNDLGKHPSTVSTFNQPHILGFFGVIGNYSGATLSAYSSSANEFINTGLTGLTVKTVLNDSLIGIAAGYVDATMKNIAVDASSLNVAYTGSTSTKSYGGHTTNISDYSLVGYTTKNASVKKAEESIYSVNVSSGYEFNANDQGSSTGWGGSVDMKSVLERLLIIKDSGTKAAFTFKKTYTHHESTGATSESSTNTTRYNSEYPSTLVNSDDEIGHFLFLHRNDDYDQNYAMFGGGHLQVDQYYKYVEHTGRFITDGTNYLCINGNSLENGTNPDTATLWTFKTYSSGVYYITTQYNGTTYYLNYNSGSIGLSTSTGSSRRWQIDDSGTFRDIKYNGGTNYHLAYNNGWTLLNTSGSPYYLIHDGNGHYMGAASSYVPTSVAEASALKFGYTSTGSLRGYYNQNNSSYYLGWRRASNPLYLRGSSYMAATYRLYPTTNSTTIVANGYGTGYLRTSTVNANTPDGNNYYVRWNNNSWTTTTTAAQATQITIDYIDPTTFTANLSKTSNVATPRYGPDEALSSDDTTYKMNYEDDDVTYFPLSTVNNTDNFKPADSNTAYIVSGTSISSTDTNIRSTNSIVRFSNLFGLEQWSLGTSTYPKSLSDDFDLTTGEFKNIYTIVKDGNTLKRSDNIANDYTNYTKLKDAKETLGEKLKTANNPDKKVYGVHFMDAAISMNALTTAKYIKVNGKEYTDYQLPVNSIDFHLKEFGYINFMAGTYYRNSSTDRNDSFFALYQIERLDESPKIINRILEIKNIYQHTSKNKSYSYVYELNDGTNTFYTKPYKIINSEGDKQWLYDSQTSWSKNQYVDSVPNGFVKVFDVDVIKKNDIDGTSQTNDFDYHPFYFEVPMNDGEFCLGSVGGATGAYLMYLDIAANAAKTQRTILYEKFTLTEKDYSYPLGVSLYTLPESESIESNTKVIPFVTPTDETNLIDASDSACMIIKAASTGIYSIDRNNGDVTLSRANQTNAPPRYAGEAITLLHEKNSSTNIQPDYDSSSTSTIKRMQYYDYNVNLETTVVTTITDIVTGEDVVRTIYQKNYNGSDTTGNPTSTYAYDETLDTPVDQRANIKIYNTSNGYKISTSAMIDTTESGLPISDSELPTTSILTFKLIQNGGNEYDDTTLLVAVVDEDNTDGVYYLFDQYKITLTPESGSIRITVIDYVTGNTIYFGTTQVTGEDQVITIPAP